MEQIRQNPHAKSEPPDALDPATDWRSHPASSLPLVSLDSEQLRGEEANRVNWFDKDIE